MSGELAAPARRGLSAAALKGIALASMTVDHFAASGLYLLLAVYFGGTGDWYLHLRLVGRLAFPIYCFLLTEGFHYTRSRKRYALRLALFAVLSEAPFDLMCSGAAYDRTQQNVFFTLLLGLCALMIAEPLARRGQKWRALAAVLGLALVAEVLRTDYGFFGVALIAALWFLRERETERALAGGALLLGLGTMEVAAWPSFLLLHFYNGRRGAGGKALQWAFYLYYPAHLLLFAWLTNVVSASLVY